MKKRSVVCILFFGIICGCGKNTEIPEVMDTKNTYDKAEMDESILHETDVAVDDDGTESLGKEEEYEDFEKIEDIEQVYDFFFSEYEEVSDAIHQEYEGIIGDVYHSYSHVEISDDIVVDIQREVSEQTVYYSFVDIKSNEIIGKSKSYDRDYYNTQLFQFCDLDNDGIKEILIQVYTENSSGIAMVESTIYQMNQSEFERSTLVVDSVEGLQIGEEIQYSDVDLQNIYQKYSAEEFDGFNILGVQVDGQVITIYYEFKKNDDGMWIPELYSGNYIFDSGTVSAF